MMKRNIFTAALESEVPGTVGIDAVVTEQQDLQPKPGVGEVKGGEASLDEVKADKEFGEEAAIAEHDEIDAVAESQEHTLALEHLQATAMRFCRLGAALEEIAETAQANLDQGQPMDPETVAMVTTAIDANGIGEPMEGTVATESFEFSATIATEGFIDAIKDRAQKVWNAVAKFFKKAIDLTVEKLKRCGDFFRELVQIYEKLEKEGDILATNAGKPFQSAKYEKALHDALWAPASTKSVVAAVDNAADEYAQVMDLADVKLNAAMRALNNSWATDKPEQVISAMNKVLTISKMLADMGSSKFMHSSTSVEVNLPERITLDNTGALQGTKVVYGKGVQNFTAGVRTASLADVKHLKASANQATRAFNAVFVENLKGDLFDSPWKQRGMFDAKEDDKVQARKLLTKYVNLLRITSNLIGNCVWGAAEGFVNNHRTAAKWVRLSVAEAKAAKREGKAKAA